MDEVLLFFGGVNAVSPCVLLLGKVGMLGGREERKENNGIPGVFVEIL